MTDVMEEDGFSLADFADLDISGIDEIRYEQLPAGDFEFEVTESELVEDEDKEGLRRFKTEIVVKILEVKAVLERNVDKDSLVGKTHTERFFVKPGDPQEEVLKQIGRIRAFITDIGANSAGKLGEVVANLKGHTFRCKIATRTDKDDKTRKYARLAPEPKKQKAA